MTIMTRRFALTVAANLVLASQAVLASADRLESFLDEVRRAAAAAGVSPATTDRELSGLSLDQALLSRPAAQGEFSLSPGDYVARLTGGNRAAAGRAQLSRQRAALAEVEGRTGVPGEIVVALWGLESGFGGAQGDHDVLRSLATLGATGDRRDLFRDEMVAALAIIDRGEASRTQLKGSWAGAMGQPQFMPSSYLKYGSALSGNGSPDIWRSAGDSLASIGNFMRLSGWQANTPAVFEVRVPGDFDWKPVDLPFTQWRALGFARIDGRPLPDGGQGSLFLPAGAQGPALLLTDNWEAIRAYNTSDAYALAVHVLAEKIAGRTGFVQPWPPEGQRLTSSGRRTLQERLRAGGFYNGTIDGRFGRATRRAVHAWQVDVGWIPADGFATPSLLERLAGGR